MSRSLAREKGLSQFRSYSDIIVLTRACNLICFRFIGRSRQGFVGRSRQQLVNVAWGIFGAAGHVWALWPCARNHLKSLVPYPSRLTTNTNFLPAVEPDSLRWTLLPDVLILLFCIYVLFIQYMSSFGPLTGHSRSLPLSLFLSHPLNDYTLILQQHGFVLIIIFCWRLFLNESFPFCMENQSLFMLKPSSSFN